jgi:ATP-dependent DNA helicase 2 subunit 2
VLKCIVETKNIVNAANGGYENVFEYIPIGQPNASTMVKINAIEASTTSGDRRLLFQTVRILESDSVFLSH